MAKISKVFCRMSINFLFCLLQLFEIFFYLCYFIKETKFGEVFITFYFLLFFFFYEGNKIYLQFEMFSNHINCRVNIQKESGYAWGKNYCLR